MQNYEKVLLLDLMRCELARQAGAASLHENRPLTNEHSGSLNQGCQNGIFNGKFHNFGIFLESFGIHKLHLADLLMWHYFVIFPSIASRSAISYVLQGF